MIRVNQEETLLALLRSHGGALHRIARVHARDGDEEEDLYQEILMQAWKSLPSFRGDSSPGTWLYRVALNTALTWRRRGSRRNHRPVVAAEKEVAIGVLSVPPGSEGSEREILRSFLDSLDGPSRTILVLYMEGLTHQEIAGVTGLSSNAIGVRIHRMKKAFTERYVEGAS
ncbi:MAG: RNA polymerase sigma factor [Holophagales bacterium]|nr:RNA polymerase sigma factor [Holophagales bacterium]